MREDQWFVVQHLEFYDRCGRALVAYGTDIAYWWTHGTQDFGCTGGSFDMAGYQPGARILQQGMTNRHDPEVRTQLRERAR